MIKRYCPSRNLLVEANDVISFGDCIIKLDNSILFLQRLKNDRIDPLSWCLPGGHIDAGENARDASKRELFEEAGIDVNVHFVKKVDRKINCSYYYFGVVKEDNVKISREHLQYKFVPIPEIKDMNLILDLKDVLLNKLNIENA